MKKQRLNYRFHDPNPEGVAANYILKTFMEVDMDKVEQAVRQAALEPEQEQEDQGMGGMAM